jgi:hypothetical protein
VLWSPGTLMCHIPLGGVNAWRSGGSMTLSNLSWKILLSIFALATLGLWMASLPAALRTMRTGEAPGLGMRSSHDVPEWGSCSVIVDTLNSGGALAHAGVSSGDEITLDPREVHLGVCSLSDADRIRAGEAVMLKIERVGASRPQTVIPTQVPIRPDYLFYNAFSYLLSPLMLGLGLLIGVRQPEGTTYRALTLIFLLRALGSSLNFPPLELGQLAVASIHALGVPLTYFFTAVFAVTYAPERKAGLRTVLGRYGLPLLAVAHLFYGLTLFLSDTGRSTPHASSLDLSIVVVNTLIVLTALADGWISSAGEVRQRYKWLGLAFALMYGFLFLGYLPWGIGGWLAFTVVVPPASVLALIVLAYAMLRHRVFDFGFAINRAAVYTVTTASLLIVFGLLEWVAEHFLQFEGREKNIALDASLALGVFLAFHRVRDVVEDLIERVLFHEWHVREAAFQLAVRRAGHATSGKTLIDAIGTALDRFTGGAPSAVYLRTPEEGYVKSSGNLPDAPTRIDENAAGVLAMLERDAPLSSDDVLLAERTELALPMNHRGMLNGFILLGRKPGGDLYRPDEIDVLGSATHQIGLDLHALTVSALAAEVQTLQNKNEALLAALTSDTWRSDSK